MEWRTPHPYQLKTRLLYSRVNEETNAFSFEETSRYFYVKLNGDSGDYDEDFFGRSQNVIRYIAEARLSDWQSLEEGGNLSLLRKGKYGMWLYDRLRPFKCKNYVVSPSNDDYVRLFIEEDPNIHGYGD